MYILLAIICILSSALTVINVWITKVNKELNQALNKAHEVIKKEDADHRMILIFCLDRIMADSLHHSKEDYATAGRCFKLINDLKNNG